MYLSSAVMQGLALICIVHVASFTGAGVDGSLGTAAVAAPSLLCYWSGSPTLGSLKAYRPAVFGHEDHVNPTPQEAEHHHTALCRTE